MPRPSRILRIVGFAVAAGLAMAGVQPVIAAAAGSVPLGWAIGLTAPAVITAALVFAVVRGFSRGDVVQPPWYSAWLLLPGSFLLAGAAAMCIFGALVRTPMIATTMWFLLLSGAAMWIGGMALVRAHSR